MVSKKISTLLTRDEFREEALKRDNHQCVWCKGTNDLAVHHIIERKLFEDGGYYMHNGASLCPECHIQMSWRNLYNISDGIYYGNNKHRTRCNSMFR